MGLGCGAAARGASEGGGTIEGGGTARLSLSLSTSSTHDDKCPSFFVLLAAFSDGAAAGQKIRNAQCACPWRNGGTETGNEIWRTETDWRTTDNHFTMRRRKKDAGGDAAVVLIQLLSFLVLPPFRTYVELSKQQNKPYYYTWAGKGRDVERTRGRARE